MGNYVYIDQEEIYDILCGCDLFEISTNNYGRISVIEENSVMEDFIPQLIEYLNQKNEDSKFIIE